MGVARRQQLTTEAARALLPNAPAVEAAMVAGQPALKSNSSRSWASPGQDSAPKASAFFQPAWMMPADLAARARAAARWSIQMVSGLAMYTEE